MKLSSPCRILGALAIMSVTCFGVDPIGKQLADFAAADTIEIGKDCFEAAYNRLKHVYEENSKQLPKNNDGSDFAYLWSSHIDDATRWKKIDATYRACGPAGALTSSGLATLVNHKQIWEGNLKPGAIVQIWDVWVKNPAPTTGSEPSGNKANGIKVFNGIHKAEKIPDYMGHVFIFLNYEKDSAGKITGVRIADQGTKWSPKLVKENTFGLWIGANLLD
jgi:hypothetical protein